MIVLGFDTATLSTAVGLRTSAGRILCARDDPREGEHPGHATRLLRMSDELLAAGGVRWGQLDRIAVGIGPGRFTGLRVGIATARGLAQSLAIDLVGVSSLRALAEAAARSEAERERVVVAVIDARRGEVFGAAYATSGRSGAQELIAPRAFKPEALPGIAELLGPRRAQPGRAWLAVGDGALRYRKALETGGIEVPADTCPLHVIDAGAICELAAESVASGPLERVVPDYRRAPDAATSRATGAVLEGASP